MRWRGAFWSCPYHSITNGFCRELKQQSLAEWRAAREQEEREITAQLAEQQELQKQVCIAAA